MWTAGETEKEKKKKQDAFDRASAWLSLRARTEAEVRKYLKQKEYSESEIDDAVAKLLEYRYLDDPQYCRSYILMAAEKGKGKRKIQQELEQRGISREVMEAALLQVQVPDEKKRALEVAVKMARQQLDGGKELDEKFLARTGRRLAGLGYTTDSIYFVIGKLRNIKTRGSR